MKSEKWIFVGMLLLLFIAACQHNTGENPCFMRLNHGNNEISVSGQWLYIQDNTTDPERRMCCYGEVSKSGGFQGVCYGKK